MGWKTLLVTDETQEFFICFNAVQYQWGKRIMLVSDGKSGGVFLKRLCSTLSQLHNSFMGSSTYIRQSSAHEERIHVHAGIKAQHNCLVPPGAAYLLCTFALLAACFFKRGVLLVVEMSILHSKMWRDLQ